MVDLTAEMAALWTSLSGTSGDAHNGRVLQFVSARSGEGTSTVAREFARVAGARADRPVWLVDADLEAQTQMEAVAAEPDRFGKIGAPAGASPDGSVYYTVRPPLRTREGAVIADHRLTYARSAMGGRLWVTRFRTEHVPPGRSLRMLPDGAYWNALRRHVHTVCVDCPAVDRSDAALVLAPLVDAAVLVVSEDTDARDVSLAKAEIEAAGGLCAGLVFNRAQVRAPEILRRFIA